MSKARKLKSDQARRLVEKLRDELGARDLERVETILGLVGKDRQIALGDILDAVFPEFDRSPAQTRLRQLRRRLSQAADAQAVALELCVDTKKKDEPADRRAWFEGADDARDAADELTRQTATPGLEDERVDQKARLVRGERTRIGVFVCSAEDPDDVETLLKILRVRTSGDPRFVFEFWHEPLAGEHVDFEVRKGLATSHVVLVLVSHRLLADGERMERQVAATRDAEQPAPMILPVLWEELADEPSNLEIGALEGLAWLDPDGEGGFFDRDEKDRRVYADSVIAALRERLGKRERSHQDGWLDARSKAIETARIRLAQEDPHADPKEFFRIEHDVGPEFVVSPRGVKALLRKSMGGASAEPEATGKPFDALDFLELWATTPGPPHYFALLGEYGIGKTTTCQALGLRIAEARREDAEVAPSIYLDLRHVGKGFAQSEPSLEEIVERVLRDSWTADRGVRRRVSARQLIEWVSREGSLVLFDGLDEVLVHLDPTAGQRFTRQLLSILPPRKVLEEPDDYGTVPGKVLISCRTHYFRTVRDQATHLTGEDRDGVEAGLYDGLLLLPFNQEQIRAYLEKNLPGRDPQEVFELMATVHNLPELAERPYSLKLITDQIAEIERARLRGEKVTGVTLYRHMVKSWIERDSGKHQWTPDHKMRLMENLAAHLEREGLRAWDVTAMEQWLMESLADPAMAVHYGVMDRELLKEDFRTATFIVRDDEADEFRFAHSSLQEFFLASYLYRALRDRRFEDWTMHSDARKRRGPSPETLDFLGQLLEESFGRDGDEGAAGDRAVIPAPGLRAGAALRAPCARSRTAGSVAGGTRHGRRRPAGAPFRRHGGRSAAESGGASFRDCKLDRSVFRRVNLDGADFSGATLRQAEILDSRAQVASFEDACLDGAKFRRSDLGRSDLSRAAPYRVHFISCKGVEAAVSSQLGVLGTTGHWGGIASCAFSIDGACIVGAGTNGEVRVWDSTSGDEYLLLKGHSQRVSSCSFSRDGTRIVSAGSDGTVRVWSAVSGREIARLEGHSHEVTSCLYSFDDSRIVTSGSEGIVRVWDSKSGDELMQLAGHIGAIWSSAFSSDGAQIVSSGSDGDGTSLGCCRRR